MSRTPAQLLRASQSNAPLNLTVEERAELIAHLEMSARNPQLPDNVRQERRLDADRLRCIQAKRTN